MGTMKRNQSDDGRYQNLYVGDRTYTLDTKRNTVSGSERFLTPGIGNRKNIGARTLYRHDCPSPSEFRDMWASAEDLDL